MRILVNHLMNDGSEVVSRDSLYVLRLHTTATLEHRDYRSLVLNGVSLILRTLSGLRRSRDVIPRPAWRKSSGARTSPGRGAFLSTHPMASR